MAINLQKGQRINLEKEGGAKLQRFCVGCNWGAITAPGFLGMGKKTVDVDLDLSCIMFDATGKLRDHLYSPLYRKDFLSQYGLQPASLIRKTARCTTRVMIVRATRTGTMGLTMKSSPLTCNGLTRT
jgi:hypothetical protein